MTDRKERSKLYRRGEKILVWTTFDLQIKENITLLSNSTNYAYSIHRIISCPYKIIN